MTLTQALRPTGSSNSASSGQCNGSLRPSNSLAQIAATQCPREAHVKHSHHLRSAAAGVTDPFVPEYMRRKAFNQKGSLLTGCPSQAASPLLPNDALEGEPEVGAVLKLDTGEGLGASPSNAQVDFLHSQHKNREQALNSNQANQVEQIPKQDPPPGLDQVSLADEMFKLDTLSKAVTKIDTIAEDVKELKLMQDTTNQMGIDLAEVKEKVVGLQTVSSAAEGEREELIANQQVLARE